MPVERDPRIDICFKMIIRVIPLCLHSQAPGRREAMSSERDPRIDICIYLLPPHRLRQVGA